MPYIKQKHKLQFKLEIKHLIDRIQELDLENLYYIIGSIVMKTIKPTRYRQMLEVTGLLVNIRQELCRRKLDIFYVSLRNVTRPVEFTCPKYYDGEHSPAYDREINALTRELRDGCGDIYGNLNYCISTILAILLAEHINPSLEESWTHSFALVLERLNDDFYIEIMGPYEDLKIAENGDVY